MSGVAAGAYWELRTYASLFVRSLRANFTYRHSVWLSMLSAAISYAVPMLVWRYVYAQHPEHSIVPSSEMFAYLVLAGCLNYCLAMNVEARIGQRIRTGLIATDLLKPIDFQIAQAAQAVADGLFNSTLAVPIFLVAYVLLGSAVSPHSLAALFGFCLSVPLSFLIMFSIAFIFVQGAFFTYSGYGIFAARNALQQTFSGLSAPLVLYPGWLFAVAEWLPFRHTIHTPLSIYLGWIRGADVPRAILAQLVWALLLFSLGKLLMSMSVRRLEIQGG